jgi:hypothetical protein
MNFPWQPGPLRPLSGRRDFHFDPRSRRDYDQFMSPLLKRLRWITFLAFLLTPARPQSPSPAGNLAPRPLYRDPIHDGAADPTLIWNRARREWWMFYTNRRADLTAADPKDVSWVHQTRIGIAVSSDQGATWKYHGIAQIPYGTPDYTHWAPDIIDAAGQYHMFLTIVPGTFSDWNAPREIIHLTSSDLEKWTFRNKLDLASDRVIDPCLFHLPSGAWRLWYKDERDHSHIHYADSKDLDTWHPQGVAIADRGSEGPKVIYWQGTYWLVVDVWKGLAVYRSDDALHWTAQPDRLLEAPGHSPTDRGLGHHADIVVNGDRAFLFYFTHQEEAGSKQRTVLQAAELKSANGSLTVDRDQPAHILLGQPR